MSSDRKNPACTTASIVIITTGTLTRIVGIAYLNEHHQKYHEFSRLKKKQQNEYWQWRHDHEDHR